MATFDDLNALHDTKDATELAADNYHPPEATLYPVKNAAAGPVCSGG